MSSSLDSLLQDASSFVASEFGFDIEQSKLKPYSLDNWQEFCQVNDFDLNSSGIYVPASYSAYVRTDSPFLTSNIFHELYGHGLFVEHSQIGKQLTEIIQNHGDEKSFMFDEINPQEQPLGLCKTNIGNYEGFAVWLEALLCKETNNSKVWNAKKDGLREDYAQLFEFFEDAESKLSRFGLISQMGFPKHYDDDKVLDVVKRLYGSNFNNINFIIIYDSQKPYSDIDLFVVSAKVQSGYNYWLDIFARTPEEFEKGLIHFSIAVTDPLFSGKAIIGGSDYQEQLKQRVLNQPITKEAIQYNLTQSDKQARIALIYPEGSKERRIAESYQQSFRRNAEELQKGNKILTLR